MSDHRFVRWRDYLALPDEEETWIVQHLVPSGGWAGMYGRSKLGKSLMVLDMSIAIATRQPSWLGFPIHRHGPVAYFQADTPRSIWKGNHVKTVAQRVANADVWVSDPYLMPYPFDITDPDKFEALRGMISALPKEPVMVVIDTIREVHGADEDNSGAMRNVLGELRSAVGLRPAIVLISHARKGFELRDKKTGDPLVDDDDHDIMDSIRGSSYVPSKVDTMMRLTKTSLHYQGRAVGKARKRVHMDTSLRWHEDCDTATERARDMLASGMKANRATAKQLAEETGITEDAARALLRRQTKGQK